MNNRLISKRLSLAVFSIIFISISSLYGQIELAQKMVESTIQRAPSSLNSWAYQAGFYSFAEYRVWKATNNDAYFNHFKAYVDRQVNSNGNINASINSLDNSESGLITLLCYEETGEEKYKIAADFIRNVFRTYPRTSDGGLWHTNTIGGQLWLDGAYMITPFLAHYGRVFGDTTLYAEVANQIIIYASHLKDPTGLLYHAYDEDGSADWADPVTHHSPLFWGRSMGWFGMAIVEILDVIPEDHPKRPELIRILADLIHGLSQVQDKDTGLWYQVVDQGDRADNWLESSCSCMYSFFTARAVSKGYVDSSYKEMAIRAYEGILREKIYIDANGLLNLKDISEGTGVSADYAYYVNRARNVNDLHGLGAFLMMCWQMEESGFTSEENLAPIVAFTTPVDSASLWPNSDVFMAVNSFDIDGDVIRVQFYAGDDLLFTDDQFPWEFTWENVPKGDYVLTAVAEDDKNDTAKSVPIYIRVTDDFIIFEAEEGTISQGSVDTDHAGFTGAGFVNLVNAVGTYLELSLPIPANGEWELVFRYGNGSANNRPCRISLDGQTVLEQFDFLPTGDWTNWTYSKQIALNLTEGNHTLRITGTSSESAPNIDHLKFIYKGTGSGVRQGLSDSPGEFRLSQNYPNPFNPSTTVEFELPAAGPVKLSVYDLAGQEVAMLIDGRMSSGRHSITFNGRPFASGVYYYRLLSAEGVITRKFTLLK
jgi:unsaturated rhamnogalacturonyl hydrolase